MALNKKASVLGITVLIILIIVLLFSMILLFNAISKKNPSQSSALSYLNTSANNDALSYALQRHVTPDTDGDRIDDQTDNCIFAYNPDQQDSNLNGVGDACDTKGSGSSDNGGSSRIKCSKDSDCGVNNYTGTPFCSLNSVVQDFTNYTCLNPGKSNSRCTSSSEQRLVQSCLFSCYNGACSNNPPGVACSSDSDCGISTFITSSYCFDNLVSRDYRLFTCIFPGTTLSSCSVFESRQTIVTCPEACFEGNCTPAEQNITCDDNSDCGTDGLIDEPFCTDNNLTQNFETFTCSNPGTPQSSCSSEISINIIESCSTTCEDAACTIPPEDINCTSNADCGFTGFIGTEFCTINDVFKVFQTSTCNNPGTPQSSCTQSTADQFLNSCPFACTQGICILCDENPDCNDNNANTQDVCNNPGTQLSYCSHNTIPPSCSDECSSGSKQCSSANTFQTCGNFDSDSCLEWSSSSPCPGSQTCSGAGNCISPPQITCSSNSDCNDNSPSTIDTCNNPGTLSSSCTHTPIVQPPSCTNDCSLGQKICSGTNGYKICGNFDSDSCLDWSLINQCGIGKTCSGAGICG